MANETRVQEFIHKLEEGGWAKWIWLGLIFSAVIYVSSAWLFRENGFKGLTNPRAFEQAVIAREMARGHGFSTRIIRPAELWLFKEHNRPYAIDRMPDTYHAPLWPTLLAPWLATVKKTWPMTERDVQYTSDRVIAGVALGCFILATVVNFFLAWRLFDLRLALLGMGFMLICDQFWRFSMSGLPQMLMLLIFSLAAFALVRLIEVYQTFQRIAEREAEAAREDLVIRRRETGEGEEIVAGAGANLAPAGEEMVDEIEDRPEAWVLPMWSAITGALFGLLALTHGMGVWLLAGALLFVLLYLRHSRLIVALVMFGAFSLCYAPWLVRNYQVCGTPAGVSWYSGLYQIRGSESAIMRSKESPVNGATPTMFRRKVQTQLLTQVGSLPAVMGYAILAPVFFISLLHLFKRKSTSLFRWCILSMWLWALLGMSIFGLDDQAMRANDLHVLFIPLLTFYGLAYVLVLWTRLEIHIRLFRISFLILLYLVSGLPFLLTMVELHTAPQSKVEWPPYVPPYIAILGGWTTEREIIMSDMPWAVAWYADRKSLWLPTTVGEFNQMNDYNLLAAPIVGLYLTPISGDQPFLTGIVKGEYKDWTPFVLRSGIPRNFPLRAVTVLPVENQCTFYADRDRWTSHED